MMMNMLEEGGVDVVTDHERKPDEDNPKGYYEFEPVKQISENHSWLPEIRGKAVKMVSRLLLDLPDVYDYRIIFMQRNLDEILASQRKMLERSGKKVPDDETELKALFSRHLDQVKSEMEKRSNTEVFYASFNAILDDPEPIIRQIEDFLSRQLNTHNMQAVIDRKLYRQRRE